MIEESDKQDSDSRQVYFDNYSLHPGLSKIRVVLVETSHPGNIGAVARAMKNMGLSRLVLVSPKHFPSQEASQRASSAADILNNAQVVATLDEAVVGAKLVVGASARLRKVAWPQLDVRETAMLALQTAEEGEIAMVFGREDSGLSNAELDKCHYLAHIPSNPVYSSLNLGQAVQVFAYECLMAADLQREHSKGYRHKLATADQLEGFYEHMFQTLQDIEFLDPAKNARFMRRMRRLFNRTQLDVKEIDILRGILSAAQRQAERAQQLGQGEE
ncbi:RNA methyltransferase [Thiomicrorhabdus cannonii]|uniref:RNA methyltransferase n=1 Tax=Thiomicrorhabdus cannonii TaxID=2748011 RepID=UPI0015BAE421|nr:RNA methyltransferase [Thiomicrorhabdus cannonii]